MADLAEERSAIERKVDTASITIQKNFRMFFQRRAYLKMKMERDQDPKEKLNVLLEDM